MPATTPQGLPYPLPTEPVAEGAQAIRNLAEGIKGAQLIEEKDPSAGINVFSAIPQSFDHLRLLVWGRSVGAVKSEPLNLRLNGLSVANYYQSNLQINAGVVTVGQLLAQTYSGIGILPGATATAKFFGLVDLLIPNYSAAVFHHWTGLNYCHAPAASNNTDLWTTLVAGGTPAFEQGVNAITLFCGTGGNLLAAGSRAWLYGIRGA